MGGFKDGKFVAEYACRTKLNYLMQKCSIEENELARNNIEKTIATLKDKMEKEGFIVSKYYEVTDLLNSMLGLLIFPEQNAYENTHTREEDTRKYLPTLYRIVNKEENYTNSYKRDAEKTKTPRTILTHMRNAAAHDRVMIKPVSKKTISGEHPIEAIEFRDQDTMNPNWRCKLIIPVGDLEEVLFEICDYLLSITKWHDKP